MSVEEWIGSLITLLALAFFLFFGPRGEERRKEKKVPSSIEDEEVPESLEELFEMMDPHYSKGKKKKRIEPAVSSSHFPDLRRGKKEELKRNRPLKVQSSTSSEIVHKPQERMVGRIPRIARILPPPFERTARVQHLVDEMPSRSMLVIASEIFKPR